MKSPKHNDAKRLASECCVDTRSESRRLETVAVLLGRRVWISDGLVQGVAGWLVRIGNAVPVMA